jgi:cytidylate kinase
MYLNDTNVEKEIRTIEVSSFVSKVATITEVRKLVEHSKEMGNDKGIVMDGRDIGTVVFPNELKILTASANYQSKKALR